MLTIWLDTPLANRTGFVLGIAPVYETEIVWTPLARLYHFESLTRDKTVTQEEGLALERRWKRFYNNEVYSR